MSDRCVMAALVWLPGLTAASCHSWARPLLAKLLRLMVTDVVADGLLELYRFLLMTATVRAPSDERMAYLSDPTKNVDHLIVIVLLMRHARS